MPNGFVKTRVTKGWNISGKFPKTFPKLPKDSKLLESFWNVLEIILLFATLEKTQVNGDHFISFLDELIL